MGQRFLRSRNVRDKIIAAAELLKDDTVLEVGPGDGCLTEALAERAGRVVAVEKDARLVTLLQEKFYDVKNIKIVEGDILATPKCFQSTLNVGRYKIVANIPYYLTSRLLRMILEAEQKPILMVLMVQREVAERVTVKPPHMNMLALSVQTYGKIKRVARVPRGAFSPPPRVDSAIIKIFDISDDFFKKNHVAPEHLFTLARRAFAQKRKMLSNSLGIACDTRRPQALSLLDWIELAKTQKVRYY